VKQKIFTEQKRGKEDIEKGKERKRGNKKTDLRESEKKLKREHRKRQLKRES
jgi:hypothetical protein